MRVAGNLAIDHLLLRLRPIHRSLHAALDRQKKTSEDPSQLDLDQLCVTTSHAEELLAHVADLPALAAGAPAELTPQEQASEKEMRAEAGRQHTELPLDRLARVLGLTGFEQEVLLLCAAPEIDRAYERLYAFLLDDLNRLAPCVELVCSLTAVSFEEKLARRRTLGRFGVLRRAGLIQAKGESGSDLRREIRLGQGLFEFLTGAPGDPSIRFRDPHAMNPAGEAALPPNIPEPRALALAEAISKGGARVVIIWGPRQTGHADLVRWIAANLKRPLRAITEVDGTRTPAETQTLVRDALEAASALGAILWLPLEGSSEALTERVEDSLASAVAGSPAPVLITSTHPLRPLQLVQSAGYVEIELTLPDFAQRQQMWHDVFPGLEAPKIADLAARFRLGSSDIRAVKQVASAAGDPDPEAACAVVTRRRCANFAALIRPKRTQDDLVLPPDLQHQVLEVASFFRLWPRVGEQWGFAQRQTGAGGVKALFTGEPGTGKTLSAEVIAGELKLQLLKVDLARVVSKWVGETEKNLESVFREAEESHSVLFFDEADALFGKRGEVQHGADRYANLEVSYLLQRLEDHYGLVILASNLKDQIDNAFIRRFQIVLNFPRPSEAERLKIWKIAFPKAAPRDEDLDLQFLARLNLTGAAITSIALTAAMLAADEPSLTITMSHVIRATARQFRREARVLAAHELGPHAALLRGDV